MLGFWFLFDKDDEEYLLQIIKKLSDTYDSEIFIPHITAHGITNLQFNNINKKISDYIKNCESFVIMKNKLLFSNDYWKTLFIDIVQNKNMSKINEKLKYEIPIIEKYYFQPHISLIYQNLDKDEKIKLTKELKIKKDFKISRLSIQKYSKNIKKWKSVKEYSLKTINK